MNVLSYMVILSVILLAVGCSKENPNIPLKKVTLTKLHTIEGFFDEGQDSLLSFSVFNSIFHYGTDNYLYLYDYNSGSVKVFDDKGEFKTGFANKGKGPEEIESFNTLYTYNDTIFIVDNRIKIKKFSRDGRFIDIKIISPEVMSLPRHCYQINDSTIIGQVTQFIREPEKLILKLTLVVMNTDMNIRKK